MLSLLLVANEEIQQIYHSYNIIIAHIETLTLQYNTLFYRLRATLANSSSSLPTRGPKLIVDI